jgi:methionine aminotransferase
MFLPNKLPFVGTTIFTVMSALAQQHQAINLSQGFPDFDCSPILTDSVNYFMKKGYNQYAPMTGIQVLREQIAEKTTQLYGRACNPATEVTVTSGATEALFAAIAAVVEQGDEVIIFEPAYDSYKPAIALCGGITVPIALQAPHYQIDWQEVKQKISPKTKLIILNTPHNPTGTTVSSKDMVALGNLVKGTNIFLIGDEVYEHIIFDKQRHESLLLYNNLAERSFVISSFGKTFHTTGWKIGYCVAPEELSKEFRTVHQYLTFSTATPLQYAIAEYLKNPTHYISLPDFYQERRDRFVELLKGSKFKLYPSAGTYFQLADYSSISQEKDTDFAIRLTKEIGVAAIPVSVFYSEAPSNAAKLLRFCFAKKDETLEAAAERLHQL